MHGLFDTKECASLAVSAIAAAKGANIDVSAVKDEADHREEQFDLLAQVLRKSLDMKAIYEMVGIGHE